MFLIQPRPLFNKVLVRLFWFAHVLFLLSHLPKRPRPEGENTPEFESTELNKMGVKNALRNLTIEKCSSVSLFSIYIT